MVLMLRTCYAYFYVFLHSCGDVDIWHVINERKQVEWINTFNHLCNMLFMFSFQLLTPLEKQVYL